jgi:phage tail tape-measure protein
MPMDGMRTGKVVAVGIGALLGIVAAEAIAVGDAAAIVGGVAGGAIGAWWYTSSGDSASPRGNVKPASMHEAAYHGQTLVTIR